MPVDIGGSGGLFFGSGIETSGMKRDAAGITGILGGLSKNITKMDVFKGLALSAAIAAAAVAKAGFNISKDFEHRMKEVQTISRAVQDDFEGISNQLIELSTEIPEDLGNLTSALYQVVSASFDGAEGMEVLAVAARAAVAGVTDTETAVDGLTTVLNAFKIEAKDVDKVADLMFQTVKLGKTTFSEISSAISLVAPIAAATGIEFDEISAALATLTKQGVPTAQAVTQIRAAIISMSEVLGDGWAQTLSLQDAMIKVREASKGSDTELRRLLGRVEGFSAVLSLTGDNAKGAAEDLDSMKNSAGAAEKAFQVMVNDLTNQNKILANNLKAGLLVPVGDFFVSFLGNVTRQINKAFFEVTTELDRLDFKKKTLQGYVDVVTILSEKTELTADETVNLKIAQEGINRLLPELNTNWENHVELLKEAEISLSGLSSKYEIIQKQVWKVELEQAKARLEALKAEQKQTEAFFDSRIKLAKSLEGLTGTEFTTFLGGGKDAGQDVHAILKESLDFNEDINKAIGAQIKLIENLEKAIEGKADAEQKDDEAVKETEEERLEKIFEFNRKRFAAQAELHKEIGKDELEQFNLIQAEKRRLLKKFNNEEIRDNLRMIADLAGGKIILGGETLLGDSPDLIRDMTTGFIELSGAVAAYDQDLADALSTLADMATIAGQIQSGSFGGPLSAFSLAINTVMKLSQTATPTERSIQNFETIIQQYDRVLTRQERLVRQSSGESLLSEMQTQIAILQREGLDILEERRKFFAADPRAGASERQIERLIDGWKELSELPDFLWGIPVDQLTELESLTDQIKSIQDQISDIATSTMATTIASQIASGFRQGEDSAFLFADTFEKLMQNALISTFERKIVSKGIEDFYNQLATAAESGGVLTAEEINTLRGSFTNLQGDISTQWQNIQDIASAANIDLLDSIGQPQGGLSGAIGGITENTAGVLSGQVNAIRIDIKGMMRIAENILLVNVRIADNTELSNTYLREIQNNTGGSLVLDREILRSLGSS